VLHDRMGFDLYSSEDGVHFSAVTLDGFGDPYDFGVRTFQSTPYGLFFGTANYYYGAKVYKGVKASGGSARLEPPGQVSATQHPQGVQLSWTAPPGAVQYHIFRATFTQIYMNIPGGIFPPWLDPYHGCYSDVVLDALPPQLKDLFLNAAFQGDLGIQTAIGDQFGERRGQLVPLPGEEIGISRRLTSFLDTSAEPGVTYSYYVVAENRRGNLSGSSNLVTFPLLPQ